MFGMTTRISIPSNQRVMLNSFQHLLLTNEIPKQVRNDGSHIDSIKPMLYTSD